MEYREIGRSGIKASSIALGTCTWAVGGGPWCGGVILMMQNL
jgi:aryl-alcohol dehydrogenase-like predicted oxidoreductase